MDQQELSEALKGFAQRDGLLGLGWEFDDDFNFQLGAITHRYFRSTGSLVKELGLSEKDRVQAAAERLRAVVQGSLELFGHAQAGSEMFVDLDLPGWGIIRIYGMTVEGVALTIAVVKGHSIHKDVKRTVRRLVKRVAEGPAKRYPHRVVSAQT